jgi:hypothetical protein
VQITGKRKGYKVFGAVEFFTGRLVYQGPEERFQSNRYQSFLLDLLSQVPGKIILIQDGARYHTSKSTRDFFAQHQDRLLIFNLPSYSPDYNPIEYLWKKVKTKTTHNRYFAEFVKLVDSVEKALQILATLMGVYTKLRADPVTA